MDHKKGRYTVRKAVVLLGAVMAMALGAALYFRAGIGSDPVSTLCDGLYQAWGIPRGTASLLVNGGIFCAFLLLDKSHLRIGSVFAAFGVGPFITVFEDLLGRLLPGELPLLAKLLLSLAGAAVIAGGRALYLPCRCGAAPLDMLVLSLCAKTHWPYRRGFAVVSGTIFLLGLLLHGSWGAATLISVFLTGGMADFWMARWEKSLQVFVGVGTENGLSGDVV